MQCSVLIVRTQRKFPEEDKLGHQVSKKEQMPVSAVAGASVFFVKASLSDEERVAPFVGNGTGRTMSGQYLHLIRQLQKFSATLLDLFIGTPDQVSAADAPGKKGIAGKHELTFFVIETESTGSMAWSMHDQ